jgi:hypothetical protein
MHMASYTFAVMTNAKDNRDEEFNTWYDGRHIPDILKCKGYTAAKRFKFTSVQRARTPSPYKYLALYEIGTDDLEGSLADLGARSGTDKMPDQRCDGAERFRLRLRTDRATLNC